MYSFPISNPIKFLPNNLAATAVVPVPIKGSRTISFSLVKYLIKYCGRLLGKVA